MRSQPDDQPQNLPQGELDARLIRAVGSGAVEAARGALRRGANPNAVGEGGLPCLHLAGFIRSANCVRLLLADPGILVDARGPAGETALMVAAGRGALKCVRELLRVGDARAVDAEGRDALMHAVLGNHPECVSLIAPQGDCAARDANGLTALMHAASARRKSACVRRLLPWSDPRALTNDGETILMLAARARSATSMRLLAPVSDVGAKNKKGFHAMDMSLSWGRVHGARALKSFVDHSAKGWRGLTPLLGALSCGQTEVAFELYPVSDHLARNEVGRRASELCARGDYSPLGERLKVLLREAERVADEKLAITEALSASAGVEVESSVPKTPRL